MSKVKVFRSMTNSQVIIAEPSAGNALCVDSVAFNLAQQRGGMIELYFSDGINQECIAAFDTSDSPINIVVYYGDLGAWENAWVELRNTNSVKAIITLIYDEEVRMSRPNQSEVIA